MYTRGPWILFTGCSWRRFRTDDYEKIVCEPTIASDGHPDLIVSEEDARLIAAAPELLEACKEFMKEWDNPESNGNPEKFVSNLHDKKVTHSIRQAIAKATQGEI